MTTDPSTINAAIGATATIGVALISAYVTIRLANRPRKDAPRDADGMPFSGSPTEAALRALADVQKLRTDFETELAEVKRELGELKTRFNAFTSAVRRYLTKIAQAWTHAEPMPRPDDADLEILAPVLPPPKP